MCTMMNEYLPHFKGRLVESVKFDLVEIDNNGSFSHNVCKPLNLSKERRKKDKV